MGWKTQSLSRKNAMDFSRCNLSSLQQNNLDCGNIGQSKKSVKDYFQSCENDKKKKFTSIATQVNLEGWVTNDDLSNEVPTETYWKVLAEKRRMALDNALKENERLWLVHETLKADNAHTRQLLDEANSFLEVFKEVVNDANDTGIDVGEISLVNGD